MASRLLASNYIAEFRKRVAKARKVQIASAWMRESEALTALLKRECMTVEVIVGIRGNATSPTSLQTLAGSERTSLRIADGPALFHPKLFLFHCEERTVAWIGSANFTAHGMKGNTELVLETDDRRTVEAMVKWFDEQWDSLRDQDTRKVVADYAAQWKEPDRYVGDQGGSKVSPPQPRPGPASTVVRFRPSPRRRRKGEPLRGKGERLRGKIVYGGDGEEQHEYKSAAAGLRWFLAWLATGREDDFLTACQNESAFDKGDDHFIGRGRNKDEAVNRKTLAVYRKSKPVTCLPGFEEREWKWWISEHSNNKEKWRMVKTAVEVANSQFGDRIELKDTELTDWPGS